MLRNLIVMAVAVGLGGMVGSCGCDGTIVRPYKVPKVGTVLQAVKDRNESARSFRAESTMDYWVGKERVKGTVQVQGRIDRRLRFNALNPGSGNVAIDLACDGTNFVYLNQNENCVLSGPCDATAISQLLRIELEPEDFLLLAVGSTPVLEGEAVLSWDDKGGREVVTITTPDKRVQTIKLDGRIDERTKKAPWDVLESTVTGPDGKVEWKLTNKDFKLVEVEGGKRRLPGKTRFEQPPMKADLIVDWGERSVNLELAEEFFQLAPPDGLPQCGSK